MSPLLQVPPEGVLLNVDVAPAHTNAVPVMAVGIGLTVTLIAASGPQQPAVERTLK